MSDHSALPPEGPAPEHQAPAHEPAASPAKRRSVIAPIAAAAAVVVVAGGGFAAWRFLSDPGVQPAEVLPASTFALVNLDLAPDGEQQVQAVQALRKFPSLREELGASSRDDLMEEVVTSLLEDSGCKGKVDYAEDVAPWIGRSIGIGGVVLGDEKPTPVGAIEIEDAEKARDSFPAIVRCLGEDGTGFTVTEDYLILSDSTDHAEAIASAGEKAPLAEDAAYQRWTKEAGDPGVAGFYLAKEAPTVMFDAFSDSIDGALGAGQQEQVTRQDLIDDKTYAQLAPEQKKQVDQQLERLQAMSGSGSGTAGEDPTKQLREQLEDFDGLAGTLRFADGGLELAMAGGGVQQAVGTATVSDQVRSLPDDTAAAIAFAVDGKAIDQLTEEGSPLQAPLAMAQGFLDQAGITLPDDLKTLLGSSLSVSVGGKAPADLSRLDPAQLPVGLLVTGDPQEIQAVITKIEKAAGVRLADLPASLKTSEDQVALSTTAEYADQLVQGGDLGDQEAFQDVVPEADKASGVIFVQLDGAWREAIGKAASSGSKEDREAFANLDVVRALGISGWQDGKVSHGLVRLTLR